MRVFNSLKNTLLTVNSGFAVDETTSIESADTKALPKRPGIPVLLPGSLVFWVCAAIAYSKEVRIDEIAIPYLASIVAVVIGLTAIAAICKRASVALALLFALLGAVIGCAGTAQMDAFIENSPQSEGPSRFVLEQDSSKSEFGSSCIALIEGASPIKEKVLLYLDTDEALYRGQVIEGSVSLRAFDKDKAEQYWLQGVSRKGSLKDMTIVASSPIMGALIDIRRCAIELFGQHCGESAGILQALVCGYRNTIRDEGTYEQFKICGIAHIVAVSGAHLAIVATLMLSVLRFLKVRRSIAVVVEIIFLLMYLIFAGVPISALRAVFMVVLSLTSFVAMRRSASLNSLALCIIAFIVLTPSVCVSVSFFLSAGSVLGIAMFSSLFASVFAAENEKVNGLVGEQLALTVSSNVITLPASAALFSQLSLISPVANIVAAPLFSLGCIAGLICVLLSMLLPFISSLALGLASILVAPLKISVSFMSAIPYASIALALPFNAMIALSVVLSVILWLAWSHIRLRTLRIALLCALLAFGACIFIPSDHGDRICMLDVGQGDSFLIESEGSAVLIDTGNKDSMLREAIAQHGIKRLDAVLITHPDSDHCDSLDSLAGYVDIGSVLVADDLLDCECEHCSDLRQSASKAAGADVVGLNVGDDVSVGHFKLEVVWPRSFQDEGGNSDSLSVVLTCDSDSDGEPDMSALFCGDAESEELEQIVADGHLGNIDILKVGHHGSRVSLTDELLDVMSPDIALIGVGANNRYGHPTDDAIECLEKAGALILRSDMHGCVDLKVLKDKVVIDTQKQADDISPSMSVFYDHAR